MSHHKLLSVRYSLLLVIGAALVIAGCSDQQALTGPESNTGPQLDHSPVTSPHPVEQPGIEGLTAVKNATEEYKDLSKAEADGYTLFSPFVPNMGFHYLHESAINPDGTSALDRRLNRTDPEILVYSDKTLGNSGTFAPHKEGLAAVEYAIPKKEGESDPPQHALALFNNAGEHAWHVHPSRHELGLGSNWTVHAECHYKSGAGVVLAEHTTDGFVQLKPQGQQVGTWNGDVEPSQCPTLPNDELLIVHGKWWTLHAWIWVDNDKGIFHATNPDVQP